MSDLHFTDWLTAGLMVIGYLYIMTAAGRWFISIIFRRWDKRRRQSRKHHAVNALCDALELEHLPVGAMIHIRIRDDLAIIALRSEK